MKKAEEYAPVVKKYPIRQHATEEVAIYKLLRKK